MATVSPLPPKKGSERGLAPKWPQGPRSLPSSTRQSPPPATQFLDIQTRSPYGLHAHRYALLLGDHQGSGTSYRDPSPPTHFQLGKAQRCTTRKRSKPRERVQRWRRGGLALSPPPPRLPRRSQSGRWPGLCLLMLFRLYKDWRL